jgi:hypothetical protein
LRDRSEIVERSEAWCPANPARLNFQQAYE